jgi:hypothetical protein
MSDLGGADRDRAGAQPSDGSAPDELAGGSARSPFRVPRWVSGLAGVLVIAAAGYIAVQQGTGTGDPAPRAVAPTRTPPSDLSSTAPFTSLPQLGPNPMGEDYPLAVGSVCTTTDHKRHLSVGFDLSNVDPKQVRVLSVAPSLPVGGLHPAGVVVPGARPCPGLSRGSHLVLDQSEHVTIRLKFRLPAECPKPFPVGAYIVVREGRGRVSTQRILLLSDLGQLSFRSCPGGA